MEKKKNNIIFLIIGIVLAVIILNNYGNLGLFSTQQVCTWDDPETTEELINWTKKVHLRGIAPLADNIFKYPEKTTQCTNGYFPCDGLMCEESFIINNWTQMGGNVMVINNKNFYFSDDVSWFCNSKDNFAIGLSPTLNITTKLNVINKYFEDFYTCQEPQKCYSYLYAGTCQEVPCDFTRDTKRFNTLEGCQNYYQPTEIKWYNKVIFNLGDFGVKLWMLLTGLGIIILIIFIKRK